eukprot:CAMPEP_0179124724 /NCGR_PEP_ID=MMETSP0796-20121207/58953_1 /TAXON_ID=73915 /ORGANISM="Pyrodinium bahamense, Strain pbaha01" /LENGTH=333 /DNA_ID=CAMNT_0020823395 /DNA_START=48 /DNA_END=1045 /DNA_ORIENTATION=-
MRLQMSLCLGFAFAVASLVPRLASTEAAAATALDALTAFPSDDACSGGGARGAAVLGDSVSGGSGGGLQGTGQPCTTHLLDLDRGGDRCIMDAAGAMHMRCESVDTRKCGARLVSDEGLGLGNYSVKMRAAKGPGLNTAFYLSTGEDHERSRPWNEISFEVLGTTTRRVWSNFFTLPFSANKPHWKIEKEHPLWIDLPFDASADFHMYTIVVDRYFISWLVDGKTYRVEDISDYNDLTSSLAAKAFEVYLSLWGQNLTSMSPTWGDQGFLEEVRAFPVTGSFKDLTLSGVMLEAVAGGPLLKDGGVPAKLSATCGNDATYLLPAGHGWQEVLG